MTSHRFRIRCTQSCATAQRAQIALAERGTVAEVEVVAAPPVSRTGNALPMGQDVPLLAVTDATGGQVEVAGTLAMIGLIDELFRPASFFPEGIFARAQVRDLMELGWAVQHHLSLATRARESNEADMMVHHLRDRLSAAEAHIATMRRDAGALDAADLVLAPTLWRLHLLDRTGRSFLLAGFPALSRWAERLAARPGVARVLDDAAARAYLDGLRRRGARILDDPASDAWAGIVHLPARLRGAG